MSYTILYTTVLLAAVSSVTSLIINGRRMSMDEAIYEVGMDSGVAGVFDLIQDKKTLLVELDMLMDRDTYNEMYMVGDTQRLRNRRKALNDPNTRWPNARVPYNISDDFTKEEADIIREAMDEYEKYTCLRFVDVEEEDKDWVSFVDGDACQADIGRARKGRHRVILAENSKSHCRRKGLIMHEIGHTIGWVHEHNRPDRDDYVTINMCNIRPDELHNFNATYSEGYINTYGLPYDYYSVMHYKGDAFAIDDTRATIVTDDLSKQCVIGYGESLSFRDIQLANLMYNCTELKGCEKKECPEEGFQGPNCTCWCPKGHLDDPIKECDGCDPILDPIEQSECRDKDPFCPILADSGLCTGMHEGCMTENCGNSCRICDCWSQVEDLEPFPEYPNCSEPEPANNCVDKDDL